jgi:fatty-acyl-CoA synthase
MAGQRLERAHCDWFAGEPIFDCTIGALLRDAAAAHPQAEALVEGLADGTTGRRWTYGELLRDAEGAARALATRFQPGEKIAVWAPNSPEWVLLEYAAALAGLVLVTVNPAYQKRELEFVLRQSGAAGLLLVESFRGNPMRAIAEAVAGDIDVLRSIIDLAELGSLDGEGALPQAETNDPAQIQYTSGTTGFPKGVVLSHRNLTNNARLFGKSGGMPRGSATIGLTPLFHTIGCSLSVLGALQLGGAYISLPAFEPQAALDLIERERVVWTIAVPTIALALIEAQRARPRDLAALAIVGAGGAMVSPELARSGKAVLGADIRVAYGQTESSPLITVCRPQDDFDDVCNTIGRPALGCEIKIVDPASGEILPCDVVGEICARSYATMLGYHDNPEATAAAVDAQGWLHTGDLGTMDERGFVKITGRVKDMIIRGGENLFPAEIENVLLEHQSVLECAVVGVPDERFGEAVAAFVRLADGHALDVEALRKHCRAQIAAPKCPAHWQAVEEWPMTGSGKIQKFALRDSWLAERGVT